VKELLRQGISANSRFHSKSCLQVAMQNGQQDVAWYLIKFGADPQEIVGHQRNSLLHIAAKTHNFGFVDLLLRSGSDPNAINLTGQTPLHLACRSGDAYMVSELIGKGANPRITDIRGNTPLHLAATSGSIDTCRYLIVHGADVNALNRKRASPLLCAQLAGHEPVATLLVAKGANTSPSQPHYFGHKNGDPADQSIDRAHSVAKGNSSHCR